MTTDVHSVQCCGREIEPVIEQPFTGSIGRVWAVWRCEHCGAEVEQAVGWIEPSEAEIVEPEEVES